MGARAAAGRRGARRHRAVQDQPRRRVRRDADVRGLRRPAGRARRLRRSSAATTSCACAPPRSWPRSGSTRSGSTSTAPTARRWSRRRRRRRRYWAYATLNDAFTVRRRCRPEDAIYGLGEKTGRHNRKGRDFTLWNTDVLDPRRDRGVHRGRAAERPARGPDEHRVRPVLRLDPVLLPPRRMPTGTMAASFVDNGYRGALRLHRAPSEYRDPLRRRPVHRVRLRRPGDAGHPRGLHVADRAHGAAAAVVARLPPVPLVRLHAGRGRGARRSATASASVPCDALWLDIEYMDGYRVFTWDTERSPTCPGCSRGSREQGFRVDHDHRPRREVRPGLLRCSTRRVERDVLCRTEGGDIYIGQVWPGDTAFPDFVTEEGARVVGRAQRRPRAVRARRHLERHERAGDRAHPARARCASTAAAHSHERFHNQYALLMAMGTIGGPARRRCPTSARSCSPAPASPASSATPPTGWATTCRAGTTCG